MAARIRSSFRSVLTASLTPKGKAAGGRLNWRRATIRLQYTLSKTENNSDGAFVVPPSGTLDTEWAPALNDRPHRFGVSLNSQALQNLNATLRVEGSTGVPYNITTGLDGNGDLIFNDRPAGVTRNSVRAASPISATLNLAYAIDLGARTAGDDAQSRYRLGFTLQIANLTNRYNYGGYSGVMTSAYFLQPTLVQNPRKVDIGVTFAF